MVKPKGIDDALVAGVQTTVIEGEEAKEKIIQICKEAGVKVSNISGSNVYETVEGKLCLVKKNKKGKSNAIEIANFTAQIKEEEMRDDGNEQTIYYRVKGKMHSGEDLPEIIIPASEFRSLNWIARYWGVKPIIQPGIHTREHLIVAIQYYSKDVKRVKVYNHTGWIFDNSEWKYLSNGVAIGKNGLVEECRVVLERNLCSYSLPNVPPIDELRKAIRASLDILTLFPSTISYLLLALTYLSPLGEALLIDFSIFISGVTGCFKSELCAIAQAHFGKGFHGKNLPGNFASTANALELLTFKLKDILLVIDDFVAGNSNNAIANLKQISERIFRAQGNKSGRERMNVNGSLRKQYYPRGLILANGEFNPDGQSIQGRMLILEISQGEIESQKLSVAQKNAQQGLFSQAMAGYISWLASKMDDLKKNLTAEFEIERDKLSDRHAHKRTAEISAKLIIGFQHFLAFAQNHGVISEKEKDHFTQEAYRYIRNIAEQQGSFQQTEDPTLKFMSILGSAFTSCQAHLVGTIGRDERPPNSNYLGWKNKGTDLYSSASKEIGWADEEAIYLEPNTAYKVIYMIARDQGEPFTISKNTLFKRISQKKISQCLPGRNTHRLEIEGQRRYVIKIPFENFKLYCPEIEVTETTETKSENTNKNNMLQMSDRAQKESMAQKVNVENKHAYQPYRLLREEFDRLMDESYLNLSAKDIDATESPSMEANKLMPDDDSIALEKYIDEIFS